MRYCEACRIHIKGDSTRCPLCDETVIELPPDDRLAGVEAPFPVLPLRFQQYFLIKLLSYISIAVLAIMIVVYIFFPRTPLRAGFVFFGLASLWLIILAIIRKRRNVAKNIVYQLAILSSLAVFWDYYTHWRAWSITYAVPMLCCSALLAMLLAVRLVRQEVGDYILYLATAAIIGFVPLLFLIFAWVRVLWPSILSISFSALMMLYILSFRNHVVWHELKKRLHM